MRHEEREASAVSEDQLAQHREDDEDGQDDDGDRDARVVDQAQAQQGDPDRRERLTIDDAIKLDLHYREAGGLGFPIFETYGRLIEAMASERFADAAAIGAVTMRHAKEAGEATAALVAAAQPGADREVLETALRELEQADDATAESIATVRQALARARDAPSVPDG